MRKAALWQIGRAGSAGAIVPALQRVLRAREAWLDAVGRLALAGGKRKAIPGAFANLLAAKGRLSQARSDLSALAPVLDGALAGLARQLTSDGPDLQQQIVEALPVLDAEHQRVKVEGKWYDVGQPATKMLRTLFAAKGAWVGGSALGKGRHDKTRNRMPEQVRNIIESDKTQGYRIPALLPK